MLEQEIYDELMRKGLTVSTAESLTGGLLAGRLINVPGASNVLPEGFITYSNAAKHRRVHVSVTTLETKGAVSAECACEMARGAAMAAGTDIGLATTGFAGPDNTPQEPAGLVYIGICTGKTIKAVENHFKGDRAAVREQAVVGALELLKEELGKL